ncbi:LOW QUALITY PROTEIN: uncharacterized protein LOC130775863 [Actinidia eriantha]|uniref:LOW QUALITY PROTEIN: uncharacterized protein LOC130775863 n=1 Tax=Actinidia eriantha TaxID=165200 RepID=UPI0025849FE5|nr:LOW QUALITY PROTEIN: uncharacterized protein LOC130775863 [Actinidia eriantha]
MYCSVALLQVEVSIGIGKRPGIKRFGLRIVGLYPVGSPSRNSQRPRLNLGRRGGLEIVFNQQLTRLGYYLTSCVIAPSAKILASVSRISIYIAR